MTEPFPEAIRLKLKAALLAALEEEDLDIDDATAVAVNPVLGETVISLEDDS